jgi:hypothetical protein
MKKILIVFFNLYVGCLLINAGNPVRISDYHLDIILQDSAIMVSGNMTLSSSVKSKNIFLLFNSCVEIQEFYMNNQSVNYSMHNDTIWFSKPTTEKAQISIRYTIPCSLLYDTTSKGDAPYIKECSRVPLLYNHSQIIFERWYRWYPVLYDNFAQYHVSITTPSYFKAFSFVPVDSIKFSDSFNIHYFTLFDEDFPILVASMDICRKKTITEKGIRFNFYFIPDNPRFLKWEKIFITEPIFATDTRQTDSLLHIISRRCINAFFWYNDNLWKKDIKEINIIESTTSAGFGLGNFILIDENLINLDLLWHHKVSHEIAHIWLGLHIEYECKGKYFLGESVTEYINLMFYESWAGKQALEEAILDSRDFREFKNPPKFTVTFDEVLQSKKHTTDIALHTIYAKGPVFLHEFRKLVGKEKLLQIIIDTYNEDNKLITLKDFENNIKKHKCWKAYKQLFKMVL